MHNATAFIVDSGCSLPQAILDKYKISVLPIRYTVDRETYIDPCNSDQTLAVYKSGLMDHKHLVNAGAPSALDFENAIIDLVKKGFDNILIQTINRSQGQTYTNANRGATSVKQRLDGRNISVSVMDSGAVYSGQGLMITETVRRAMKTNDLIQAQEQMKLLSKNIHTYILSKYPYTAHERTEGAQNEPKSTKIKTLLSSVFGVHPILCNINDTSNEVAKVLGFNNAIQQLFEHVASRIQSGLLCPIITINYAGPLEELEVMPGFAQLQDIAKEHEVMLLISIMSICGSIHNGVGTLAIAMATQEHEWKIH